MDGMKTKDVPAHREAHARCLGSSEELLPGIPDEIAIDQIASKLPRKALHVLSTVSHAWLHAIRSHQVYRARVRSNSAETLALIEYEPSPDVKGIALYSMRDGGFHELPSLPDFAKVLSELCHWKCLNGKVYVLFGYAVSRIYMLDLAGQRSSWKQCRAIEASDVVERVVESRTRSELGVEFMAHGKLHLMNSTGIHVQNVDGNSWTHMHSHSFPALEPVDSLSITPFDVLFVEDELLATVGWHNRNKSRWGEWLFRSRGLGSANEQILWHKAGVPLSFTSYCPSYVSFRIQPIQL